MTAGVLVYWNAAPEAANANLTLKERLRITSTGTLSLTPDVGAIALDAAGEVYVGGAARAGAIYIKQWDTTLKYGMGVTGPSPNNNFYLWDYPNGRGRITILSDGSAATFDVGTFHITGAGNSLS